MSQTISNFHSIRPQFESTHEETLDWIVKAHTQAESLLSRLHPNTTFNKDEFSAKLKTPPTQKKSPEYSGKKFEISNYKVASNGDLFVSGQNFKIDAGGIGIDVAAANLILRADIPIDGYDAVVGVVKVRRSERERTVRNIHAAHGERQIVGSSRGHRDVLLKNSEVGRAQARDAV